MAFWLAEEFEISKRSDGWTGVVDAIQTMGRKEEEQHCGHYVIPCKLPRTWRTREKRHILKRVAGQDRFCGHELLILQDNCSSLSCGTQTLMSPIFSWDISSVSQLIHISFASPFFLELRAKHESVKIYWAVNFAWSRNYQFFTLMLETTGIQNSPGNHTKKKFSP